VKENARAEPSFRTISSKRPLADKTVPPTPRTPPPPSPLHFPPSFSAVAVAVASRSEEPPTPMANRWVRPEVSFLFLGIFDYTRTQVLSLSLSLMVVPWFRARRCTRCSRRWAWPSASAGFSSSGTSPATRKSGPDLLLLTPFGCSILVCGVLLLLEQGRSARFRCFLEVGVVYICSSSSVVTLSALS
jgi:hypothetical protein